MLVLMQYSDFVLIVVYTIITDHVIALMGILNTLPTSDDIDTVLFIQLSKTLPKLVHPLNRVKFHLGVV